MSDRENFQKLLLDNKKEVMVLSEQVERALSRSIEALKKRDLKLGHQIIAEDAKIDQKRFEIEKKCIDLIASRQFADADLNTIVAILSIIIELERIGDYADGIAKIVIMIGDEPPLKPLIDIPRMCEITVEMVHDSIASFIENDSQKAVHAISMDEVVDSIYDQIFRELLTFLMADPKTINRATRLIWVAHNIERAADRATNICERVVYTITGKKSSLGGSKY